MAHGAGASSTPGSGGITRGRGDAALEYTNRTDGATDPFEAKELPQAEYLDQESTAVVGVGAADPTVDPSGTGSGLVDTQASTGKTAWKRRVAPRHREAVRGFFGGDKKEK